MIDDISAVLVRKASPKELPEIKKLAARNSDSLGFVLRSALSLAISESRLMVAEADGRIVAFQEYYHRKRDRQTTFYHKCVDRELRRRGIGKALVDAVVSECRLLGRKYVLLKCPADLPANDFHKNYGFRLAAVEKGRKRGLNVWRLDLT